MSGGPARPEVRRKASQDYHARNRERINAEKREHYRTNRASELARFKRKRRTPREKARNALRMAVYEGRIIKPDCCEMCGNRGALHGHHTDYSKPYDVRWLCRVCHGKVHRL